MSKLRGLLSGIFALSRRFGAWLQDTLFHNRLDAEWEAPEKRPSSYKLERYAELWLDAENYALSPVEDPDKAGKPYLFLYQYAGGYENVLVDNENAQIVAEKMLKAGVEVIGWEEVEEACRVENLWTSRASEFVLVRWTEEPESFRIYSLRFKDYLYHLVIHKPMDFDYVIKKMRQAGVQIVSRDDVDKLANK